jgi:hypothetical protein
VAGGWNVFGSKKVFISGTEIFNPVKNTRFFEELEPGRDGCRMVNYKGVCYLFGGYTGVIINDIYRGTISDRKSGWAIDEAMTFNLAYLDPGTVRLNDSNSYSVKAINFAGEYLPDITNIVLKNILALGFPLPQKDNAGDLTLYLKFFEYPQTLNQITSTDKILGSLLVFKTLNGVTLKNYLKTKSNVQIKMAHIEKTGFEYGASHPYPPLRVAKQNLTIPSDGTKVTPQKYFDDNTPFSSLYVKPVKPMPVGISRDEQAQRSTEGVIAFHKEILNIYAVNMRKIAGPEKDKYFYFIDERMNGRNRKTTDFAIIKVPKEPIIIAGYNEADMPQNPEKIKLSGLLLVYRDTWAAKHSIDFRQIKNAGDAVKFASKTSSHVFEVGSVVKF